MGRRSNLLAANYLKADEVIFINKVASSLLMELLAMTANNINKRRLLHPDFVGIRNSSAGRVSDRSSHPGLSPSIKAIFFFLEPPLIFFSKAIASTIVENH